jgi:hypothetical protein
MGGIKARAVLSCWTGLFLIHNAEFIIHNFMDCSDIMRYSKAFSTDGHGIPSL